jgi:hypothetical protein
VSKKKRTCAYLVARKWVAIIFVTYHALIRRVQFDGMSWKFGVLLIRSDEEERRVLATNDTVQFAPISKDFPTDRLEKKGPTQRR